MKLSRWRTTQREGLKREVSMGVKMAKRDRERFVFATRLSRLLLTSLIRGLTARDLQRFNGSFYVRSFLSFSPFANIRTINSHIVTGYN